MEEQILNKDLFEKDIKKAILQSFIKGRNEMVKDCKLIINSYKGFKDKEILIELLNNFIGKENIDIKELYFTLYNASADDKITTALEDIRLHYLSNEETYHKVLAMSDDVQIMTQKDFKEIEEAYAVVTSTLHSMIEILHDEFISERISE